MRSSVTRTVWALETEVSSGTRTMPVQSCMTRSVVTPSAVKPLVGGWFGSTTLSSSGGASSLGGVVVGGGALGVVTVEESTLGAVPVGESEASAWGNAVAESIL